MVLGAYIQCYYTLGKRVQAYVRVYYPLGQGLLSVRTGGPPWRRSPLKKRVYIRCSDSNN